MRSQLRHTINLMIELLATGRIGYLAVLLVASFNLIEIGSLECGIACTKLLGTLEHKMFQVVRESGGLGRVVARPCAHCDVRGDAWRVVVNTQEHLHAIAQSVALSVHGITFIGDCLGQLSLSCEACGSDHSKCN